MSRRHLIKGGAAASAVALLLAGCVSPVAGPSGQYATPIGNAPVTANPTPYSAALYCLGKGKFYREAGQLDLDVGAFTAALEFAGFNK